MSARTIRDEEVVNECAHEYNYKYRAELSGGMGRWGISGIKVSI